MCFPSVKLNCNHSSDYSGEFFDELLWITWTRWGRGSGAKPFLVLNKKKGPSIDLPEKDKLPNAGTQASRHETSRICVIEIALLYFFPLYGISLYAIPNPQINKAENEAAFKKVGRKGFFFFFFYSASGTKPQLPWHKKSARVLWHCDTEAQCCAHRLWA